MLEPNLSAWISTAASERRSGTPVRAPSSCRTSARGRPICNWKFDRANLFGQDAVGLLHFLDHLAHRLIEAQARLDADDHQVQGVGQGEKDRLLAPAAEDADDQVGQVEQQATHGRSTRSASFD